MNSVYRANNIGELEFDVNDVILRVEVLNMGRSTSLSTRLFNVLERGHQEHMVTEKVLMPIA